MNDLDQITFNNYKVDRINSVYRPLRLLFEHDSLIRQPHIVKYYTNNVWYVHFHTHLSNIRVLKTLRGNPKMTISANGGFGPLQMVSELDTE